jgi:hypothetical protein
MPVEALLPAWWGYKVNVGVLTPEERSDHAFRGTALKLWIQKSDCAKVAKGRCEREGIGHCVWGDDVGIAPCESGGAPTAKGSREVIQESGVRRRRKQD